MALTGAERQQRYRARARERGEAIDALPPIPQAQRNAVAGVIAQAIAQARKVKDRGDRERLISFWRELARSQNLNLERDRLAAVLERRVRQQSALIELATSV